MELEGGAYSPLNMTSMTLRDVLEIYRDTIDGIKQQSLQGQFQDTVKEVPRDPVLIALGLEAAFGLKINIRICDFYKNFPDLSAHQKDLFSFYEYLEGGNVNVYINGNMLPEGKPLLSEIQLRFVLLKEVFTGVLRKSARAKNKFFPDTIDDVAFSSSLLDWIVEKFSIYDFGEDEYAPTVSVENAAELLALMFSVDLGELYNARKALHIKPKEFWEIGNGFEETHRNDPKAEKELATFTYERYAQKYAVGTRTVAILVKSDLILKIVDILRSIVINLDDYLIVVRKTSYEIFVEEFNVWTRSSEKLFDVGARQELHRIFVKVEKNHMEIFNSSEEISKARNNFITLLKHAQENSKGPTVDKNSVKSALSRLCPLFPFC
ncbi:MAG: hypothetical protein ACSHYC_05865 [Alphaproteobacteria bacterium]